MLFESILGTGNKEYELRFGKLERRFARRCKKIHDGKARAFAQAAALSAQEMNHWLFLNKSSLFNRELLQVRPQNGVNLFLRWFCFTLAILGIDETLPPLDACLVEKIEENASNVLGRKIDLPAEIAESAMAFKEKRYNEFLLSSVHESINSNIDMEEKITFSILVSQMISNSRARFQRFI